MLNCGRDPERVRPTSAPAPNAPSAPPADKARMLSGSVPCCVRMGSARLRIERFENVWSAPRVRITFGALGPVGIMECDRIIDVHPSRHTRLTANVTRTPHRNRSTLRDSYRGMTTCSVFDSDFDRIDAFRIKREM